jgi:isoleucyl-tRNA synthetase
MSQADAKNWEALIDLRSVANLAIEDARNSKLVGASLETSIKVFAEDETFSRFLKTNEHFLKEMFICSEVTLCATLSEYEKKEEGKEESKEVFSKSGDSDACAGKLFAAASKASGEKCLRCWCYSNALGTTDAEKHPKLCERCGPIVLDVAPDLVYHQEASNAAEAVGASSS